MILTLPQIERKVREFANIIHTAEEFIPTFGYSKNCGLPHVEIVNNTYYLIVLQDGKELSREQTSDADELLFMIMHSITFSMACDRVFENTNYKSFKERLFQSQKNIISKINLTYMQKVKSTHDTINKEYSFS